jgi:[ribosomal protein S18]-alanine N-acetyltransferase
VKPYGALSPTAYRFTASPHHTTIPTVSLPILPSHRSIGVDDLVRYFYQAETDWGRQVGEEATLDAGRALTNRELAQVSDGNQIVDAAIPEGGTPQNAIDEAAAHFAEQGTAVLKWVMNPSLPAARTQPLAEILVAQGFHPRGYDIYYLAGQPAAPITEVAGLTIIPARASFKQTRAIAEEAAAHFKFPQLADAIVLHIEDPQTDALLALRDGVPAAYVSILSMGEIGYISELFVSEKFRNLGVGRTMMSRAMETCARAVHRHVFIGVDTTNAPAVHLYERFGFKRIGVFLFYSKTKL